MPKWLTKTKADPVKEVATEKLAQETQMLGELEDLAAQISQVNDAANGLEDASQVTNGLNVATGVGGVLTGAREALGGLYDGGVGVMNVHQGRKPVNYGAASTYQGRDSITTNLGAQQVEGGAQDFITGGSSVAGGVGNIVQGVAEEIPFLDTATNFIQAGVKSKKGIEDAATSGRLGNQKARIKREGDHFLPEKVRGERFGAFATAVRTGGKTKADDVKRWPEFHKKWVNHARTLPADPDFDYDLGNDPMGTAVPAPSSSTSTSSSAKAGKGAPPPKPTWHPMRDSWTPLKGPHKAFLSFLATADTEGRFTKEFGFGTKFRNDHEKGRTGGQLAGSDQNYEDSRDLGKLASFGQRRKGETATLNLVEAAGHTLDGTGSLTAAGDFGATKLTGKAIKGTSAAYKGLKSLGKRARRVHKLRTAKNDLAYDGRDDRGILWGAKQFFGGNLQGSMDKTKAAVDESSTGQAFSGKSVKALTPDQARPFLKKLTLQLERKIDDLVRCLLSTNPTIHRRAEKILHIIAETNLAGALSKIDPQDLQRLREVSAVHGAPTPPGTTPSPEKKTYDRQVESIREILRRQLHGVGG